MKREIFLLFYYRYLCSCKICYYIKTLFKDTFNSRLTEKEIYILIFGVEVEEKDYHKRPLSKFKHEIIKELLKEK